MTTKRPALTSRLSCVGCGQFFASRQAFDLHATGQFNPPLGVKRRCRTVDEMHALGMRRIGGSHAWYVPASQNGR